MIAVKDIAFVRYQVTDLDRMETFLTDFGLQRVVRTESALYMRAADAAHHVHISELGPSNETVGFGFRASDTYWVGADGNAVAAFMRCGLGDQWTDHHTLALVAAQDGRARFDHSSFEVIDLDDVVQGGEFLKAHGWTHSWGVGRHIQGSQVFDYWRDPFGHKHEHWTDGDLVNDSTPIGNAAFGLDELSQWAPPLTPEFMS